MDNTSLDEKLETRIYTDEEIREFNKLDKVTPEVKKALNILKESEG